MMANKLCVFKIISLLQVMILRQTEKKLHGFLHGIVKVLVAEILKQSQIIFISM